MLAEQASFVFDFELKVSVLDQFHFVMSKSKIAKEKRAIHHSQI